MVVLIVLGAVVVLFLAVAVAVVIDLSDRKRGRPRRLVRGGSLRRTRTGDVFNNPQVGDQGSYTGLP